MQHTTYNIQHTKTKSSGFSLVEVLVAAAVLIISVTGTLSLIARNVTSAAEARDRVTAFYLAQEALEYVRGVRDNNAIDTTNPSWLNGLDGSNGPNCLLGKCIVDVNASAGDPVPGGSGNPNVAICPAAGLGGCPALYLNPATGVYHHRGSGTTNQTKFTREMTIEAVRTDEEVRVHATVSWPQGGITRSFTISGNIFNWR